MLYTYTKIYGNIIICVILLHENDVYHNFNDLKSILDLEIPDRYRILLQFLWYVC